MLAERNRDHRGASGKMGRNRIFAIVTGTPRRGLLMLLARLLACSVLLGVAATAFGGSSNSLMDVSPDGSRLIVANPDNGSVTVIDVAKREKLREIAIGGKLEGVSWIGNGPLALVTVYDQARVALVDASVGTVVQSLKLDVEPDGVVVDRAGKRAWVTHDYPGVVTEIDLTTKTVTRKLSAGKWLRGAALSPDESRLYVTEFLTAKMHAIDLASGKVVDTWSGQSRDNLSRNVVLHPTRPKAYLMHIRSVTDIISARGSIFPQLTVYDLTTTFTS
jgi:YVTN family beta-propeller protein